MKKHLMLFQRQAQQHDVTRQRDHLDVIAKAHPEARRRTCKF